MSFHYIGPSVETIDELIIEHQKLRFNQLANILSKNEDAIVIVPPCVTNEGYAIDSDGNEIVTKENERIVFPVMMNRNKTIIDSDDNIIDKESYDKITTSIGCGKGGYKVGEEKYNNIQYQVKKTYFTISRQGKIWPCW